MHFQSVCLLSAFFALAPAAVAFKTPFGVNTGPSTEEIIYLKGAVTQYQLSNPHNDGVACACYLLKKFDKVAVFSEGDENYTKEAQGYWSATAWTTPRCIFTPAGASDVAKAVVILKDCKARFAVKGGGHYPPPESSSITDGVLVALTKLKTLEIAKDKKSVLVGPGHRWADVYDHLRPHNLVAIGGRVSAVGVPGLLLGGGISYFGSRWGFGMDNVEEYEVVLADSSIVRSNAKTHPQLFWALKGGSSNFGIVTSFKLRVHPITGKAWMGHWTYSTAITDAATGRREHMETFLDTLQEFVDKNDDTSGILPLFHYIPSYGGPMGEVSIIKLDIDGTMELGAGSVQTANGTAPDMSRVPELFKSMVEESSPRLTGTWNISHPFDLIMHLDTTPDGHRYLFTVHAAKATRESLELITNIYYSRLPELLKHFPAEEVKNILLATTVAIQPITKNMLKQGEKNNGNSFGIYSGESYYWYILTTAWAGASNDKIMNQWSRETIELIHETLEKKELSHPFIYMNDAHGSQDPFEGYGKREQKRLRWIRDIYDPKRLWKKGLIGGFKLPG